MVGDGELFGNIAFALLSIYALWVSSLSLIVNQQYWTEKEEYRGKFKEVHLWSTVALLILAFLGIIIGFWAEKALASTRVDL